MEIHFNRVYSGRITAINHIYTSPFGMRSFVLSFGNKRIYYEIHQKQTLPLSLGSMVRFTAHQSGKTWVIDEVLDVTTPGHIRVVPSRNQTKLHRQ